MTFDLQAVRDVALVNPMVQRQHAIYLDAQRSDRRVQKARNMADILERRNRPARGKGHTALLLDVMA